MGKVRQLWESYLGLWEKLTGWKLFAFYLLHYTVLFLFLQRWVFSDFYKTEKSFIWVYDGLPDYFAGRLVYISQTVRNGIQSLLQGNEASFPFYDFRQGVMKPSIEREPILWLAILWPWDRIDILYDLLVLLRYYLVGVSFSLLGFYFKKKPLPVMIGAISYMFCGFSIFSGVRHPQFMCPMILLPLLIVGAEKVLKGERAWLFTGIVFISLIFDLYFSCMLAILILIYIFTRYCCAYFKTGMGGFGSLIGRMALWGGLGILLSGIAWSPALLQMIGTGRIGENIAMMAQYGSSYYREYVTSFIVMPTHVGYWTILGFPVLAVPSVLLLFLDERKAVKTLRILFLILTGMVCVPMVGYVMSGFNTYSNRWVFGYALCIAAIVMAELPQFLTVGRKQLAVIGVGTVMYMVLCCFVVGKGNYHEEPLILLLLSFIMIGICYFAGNGGLSMIMPLCMVITCISVSYTAFLKYAPEKGNYVSEFVKKGTAYAAIESGQYASLGRSKEVRNDDTLFYVSGNAVNAAEVNSSFFNGLNGLSFYTSCIYESYRQLNDSLEVGQRWLNNLDYGIDGRAPLLSLANVKYYALRETGDEVRPYGMKEIDRIQNGKNTDIILKNEAALSVGYTYDFWQNEDEFMELPALGRQESMLQTVVLREEPKLLSKGKAKVTGQKIPVEIADWDGVRWKDGKLIIKKEGASLTLNFMGTPGADTYLRVVNLNWASGGKTDWSLTVQTDSTKTRTHFTADGYVYANGAKTQLIYLGNSPEGYTNCTLTFPAKGTFALENLEIWCQPMEQYKEQIEALRAEHLENVQTNWRGLIGTITTSKDKFLCFSIPYDEGWTAYVDGEKTNLVQANIGFMGLELSAGDHNIELKYWMPGLTVGIILSCAGIVGAIVLAFWQRKKKRI